MLGCGYGVLPLSLGLLMAVAILASYAVAVMRGDVEAIFPYISDTGARIPESCFFGQFLNMAAFLAIGTMYCRYKLIHCLVARDEQMTGTLKIAMINAWFGVLASLGLSMVANFQEDRIESMHILGACLVFGFGVVYEIIDTVISFKMCPAYNGACITRVRLSIAVISYISVIISFITAVISRVEWKEDVPDHSRLHWKPTDPGYAAHICSTVGEWVMAGTFLSYFITFVPDFQKLTIDVSASFCDSHLGNYSQNVVVGTEPDERSRLLA